MTLEHWEYPILIEISTINPKGLDIDDLREVTFLPMKAVEEMSGRIDTSEVRPFGKVKKGYTHFKEEDILFAKITPCMENGKVAVAKNLKNGFGCGSTEFYVIRMKDKALNPYFFFHFLAQDMFRHEAQHHMTGAVGQKRVPKAFIQDYKIPLPPLGEQERIVAKIEELFPRLDKGVDALTTAKKQLARYRAAVLKAAFSGKLTKDWRKKHNKKHEWQNIQLAESGVWYGGGTPSKANPQFWTNGSIPWISPKDMKNHRIEDSIDHITEDAIVQSTAKLVPSGAILMVVRSGILRHTFPVALLGREATLNQDMKALVPSVHAPEYLLLALMAFGQDILRKCAKHGTTVHNINTDSLKRFTIPTPELSEQHEIIKRCDQMLTYCLAIEKAIDDGIKEAGRLRQSILKKAFEGRLVPQDPNDEPASELLKRIKAEQEATKPKKKAKRKKKS